MLVVVVPVLVVAVFLAGANDDVAERCDASAVVVAQRQPDRVVARGMIKVHCAVHNAQGENGSGARVWVRTDAVVVVGSGGVLAVSEVPKKGEVVTTSLPRSSIEQEHNRAALFAFVVLSLKILIAAILVAVVGVPAITV